MAGLLATILNLLTPDVSIDLKPDAVTLHCQGRIETVEPVLWIAGEGTERRIIAVGARPALTQPVMRIDLFADNFRCRSDRELLEYLEGFWRYTLSKATGRKVFIHPTVIVRSLGITRMSTITDLRASIIRTLEMAGAHEVRWLGDARA